MITPVNSIQILSFFWSVFSYIQTENGDLQSTEYSDF